MFSKLTRILALFLAMMIDQFLLTQYAHSAERFLGIVTLADAKDAVRLVDLGPKSQELSSFKEDKVCEQPTHVVVDEKGRSAYVACSSGHVSVLDIQANLQSTMVRVDAVPGAIALLPQGRVVLGDQNKERLFMLTDGPYGDWRSVEVPGMAIPLAVASGNSAKNIYVRDSLGIVFKIEMEPKVKSIVSKQLDIGTVKNGLALSYLGARLGVTGKDRTVVVLDSDSLNEIGRRSIDDDPLLLTQGGETNQAFMLTKHQLLVVSLEDASIINSIELKRHSFSGLVSNKNGTALCLLDAQRKELVLIDLVKREIVSTLTLDAVPLSFAFLPF